MTTQQNRATARAIALGELAQVSAEIDELVDRQRVLVKLAHQLGATQVELADLVGVDRRVIARMVAGKAGK